MSNSTLVITPSIERWKRTMKTAPAWLFVFTAVYVLRQGVLGVVLAIVALVFGVALSAFYMGRARVMVTTTEIGKAGFTGRARMRPRADVEAVVIATIAERFGDTRRFRTLFLLDSAGRSIMRLRSSHWSEDDMARIAERLGITPVDAGRVVTHGELGKLYPHALSWFERRPVVAGVLVGLACVVVAAVIAAIVVASRS